MEKLFHLPKVQELKDRHGWRKRTGFININSFGEFFFACLKCDAEFSIFENYKLHIQSGHRIGITGNIKQSVDLVNNSMAQKNQMQKDLPSESSKNQNHRDQHSSAFVPSSSFHKIKKIEKQRESIKYSDRESSKQAIKCDYCSKVFESSNGKYGHEREHHKNKLRYPCFNCIRSFKSHNELRAHRIRHPNDKKIKCDFCSKMFATQFAQRNHIKEDHDDRRYYCSMCTEYSTNSSINLKRHKKEKHSGQLDCLY